MTGWSQQEASGRQPGFTDRRRETAANQRRLLEYLLEHPCVDCGETDHVVLEFDHLRDKAYNVSRLLLGYSWSRILEEIKKCEVVCCNCHRRRTFSRQGAWRIFGVRDESA